MDNTHLTLSMFFSQRSASNGLPQDHCMCCFLYQEHSFPRTLYGSLFLFLRCLTKCLLGYSACLKVSHHALTFLKEPCKYILIFETYCLFNCLLIIFLFLWNISSIKVEIKSLLQTAVSLSPSIVLGTT